MNYSISEINSMIRSFEKCIEKGRIRKEQKKEAIIIANERNVPKGGALHAIFARDKELFMITRDKHFNKLLDIVIYQKPEDII